MQTCHLELDNKVLPISIYAIDLPARQLVLSGSLEGNARKYISEISVPDSVSQQFSSLSLDCDSGVYSSLTGWSNAGSGQHSRSSTVSSSSASLGATPPSLPPYTSVTTLVLGLFETKSCDSLLLDAETDAEDASSHQSQSCARNTSSPSSHGYLDQDCSSLR